MIGFLRYGYRETTERRRVLIGGTDDLDRLAEDFEPAAAKSSVGCRRRRERGR
jgi:hypothetical protein